ncbi:hypothetical protein CBM2586_B130539 [Cupriavidus phytorum]|uniref:Uncharacterized protein n=1 Tax=Cupriavidus taiwanensis TaxID=164546 RepID=A0A375CJ85_9BURK|nr:hypothetical protein CBM2586_B130539 [Cupriavidus taiwanensis]
MSPSQLPLDPVSGTIAGEDAATQITVPGELRCSILTCFYGSVWLLNPW